MDQKHAPQATNGALAVPVELTDVDQPDLGEGVPIDLGDNAARAAAGLGPRTLFYSIGSLRRLKKQFGKSLFGRGAGILDLDEDMVGPLIIEGLRDRVTGEPSDVTEEMIDALPSRYYVPLLTAFTSAFKGSQPKNESAATTT